MSALRITTAALGALCFVTACGGGDTSPAAAPSQFHIVITTVDGKPLPEAGTPLPANRGDVKETWGFTIEARTPSGDPDPSFDGVVRLSTEPGAISRVMGEGAAGRNIRMVAGKALGVVELTAVYGSSRLWVEDLGYVPAKPDKKPICSNGKDDDGDVLVDFPADPGCAYADDDNEEGGTYATGVSQAVHYALPKISDIQGNGPATPYPYEGMEVNTAAPQELIVTRVASDGFYVTDINADEQKNGYNHIFAFNFSTPPGMRVCDRVTFLSGTVNEFFGFTELSFPSFTLDPVIKGESCTKMPQPNLITAAKLNNSVEMEKIESSLARIEGYHVAANFGPKPMLNNVPLPDASNCDLDGDGQVDFTRKSEGSCSDACAKNPECSEWTAFAARGNYKVSKGPNDMIQIQTGAVAGFNPVANKGLPLDSVTGTLRNFSGGSLNWTIEARCPEDLVCGRAGCKPLETPMNEACVRPRTQADNDQGTN
ncbi:MAG: hypothetical protein ACMG6S_10805 [Byssovorax sp.]